MSESSSKDISVSEIKNRLRDEPFYVQRLGIAAMNLDYMEEFSYLIEKDLSLEQLYGAIVQELRVQEIHDPEKWLELFGIPYLYD